jgi:hypothetical protein
VAIDAARCRPTIWMTRSSSQAAALLTGPPDATRILNPLCPTTLS